jgi:WD40 repeat protein
VSGSDDKALRVWNLKTGESKVLPGHADRVNSVSVTPDGRRAVSGSGDKTLRVWNLETRVGTVLQGHSDDVLSVSLTPNGRWAVSGSQDKTLRVWNLETGACLAIARLNAQCEAVAVARASIVVGMSSGEVLFFDARGLDLLAAGRPPFVIRI